MAQPNTYMKTAQLGESLRLVGNYSGAIKHFTDAIEEYESVAPKGGQYSWAYAHRASARSGLGDYGNALDDFEKAAHFYQAHNPAWFFAQKGELYRLWARATLTRPDIGPTKGHWGRISRLEGELSEELGEHYLPPRARHPRFLHGALTLIRYALDAFTDANNHREGDPWVLAHRAATHTMRYWIGLPDQRFSRKGGHPKDFEKADKDFQSACQYNSSYGWAYAFHGILMGLHGQMPKAMNLVGQAYMCGMDRQLAILRVIVQLAISKEDSTRAELDQALQHAWNLLQMDSDETYARYYVANGLKQLEILDQREGLETKEERTETHAAVARANMAVLGMRSRSLVMEGGLACLKKDYAKAKKMLQELTRLYKGQGCDIETLTLLGHDPGWKPVRDFKSPKKPTPETRTLKEAHDLYNKLFEF